MQLKDFVAETLEEIFAGITAAQDAVSTHGGEIVPAKMQQTSVPGQTVDIEDWTPIAQIDFDVAVTVSEGTTTKGGIGVFVGAVGLGSQGQSDALNQSISRIRFAVPVKYPKQSAVGT